MVRCCSLWFAAWCCSGSQFTVVLGVQDLSSDTRQPANNKPLGSRGSVSVSVSVSGDGALMLRCGICSQKMRGNKD